MRKFKILKWPKQVLTPFDSENTFELLREFNRKGKGERIYCLNVHGNKIYFYHNEVKEVTNENA